MGQNKNCVFVHFVWATFDRMPIVTDSIERVLYRNISQVCVDDGCEVLAIGGMPDHVHLLVKLSLTRSCSDLMKHAKGGSSRFVSKELNPGEWFQWQGSYGAFSVSKRDVPKVIRYIQNQKDHHQDGTVWPEAEESTAEIDA